MEQTSRLSAPSGCRDFSSRGSFRRGAARRFPRRSDFLLCVSVSHLTFRPRKHRSLPLHFHSYVRGHAATCLSAASPSGHPLSLLVCLLGDDRIRVELRVVEDAQRSCARGPVSKATADATRIPVYIAAVSTRLPGRRNHLYLLDGKTADPIENPPQGHSRGGAAYFSLIADATISIVGGWDRGARQTGIRHPGSAIIPEE